LFLQCRRLFGNASGIARSCAEAPRFSPEPADLRGSYFCLLDFSKEGEYHDPRGIRGRSMLLSILFEAGGAAEITETA